ncbi:MAG: hypothetical protein ABI467_26845 [Kofleriaceae bacterium]
MVEAVRAERHSQARVRRRRDDLAIGVTALLGSMLALPLAPSSWNGPEVASTLAIAATCLLAGQRWAIALIAFAELLLAPTLATAAFHGGLALWPGRICAFVGLLAIVPGLVNVRRAAAALVLLAGLERTSKMCRRVHAGLLVLAALALALPLV